MVGKYEILCNDDDTCNIVLNLYHSFNRHRAILEDIKINDVDHAALDYMNMQAYFDTEDCNKMFALEIVNYFINKLTSR